ncbi:MAG TPA: hypothetical protein VK887_00265 [Pseudonocardiaceae bacterium]|nr:hypothetical protein [Pseudonocardiaceae bacterium]
MASINPAEPDQNHIRVISIYATGWRLTGDYDQWQLSLGKLDEFYGNFQVQLPQVIHQSSHTAESIAFAPTAEDTDRLGASAPMRTQAVVEVEITRAESWLFVLPSDQVVAALVLHVRSNLDTDSSPIIKLLEECAYARLIVDGSSLENHIAVTLQRLNGDKELDANDKRMPPERHQIVFAEHAEGKLPPSDEIAKVILYRVKSSNRPEFMEYRKPSGLNEIDRTLCSVTPYVSLLYGQQDYVENSVFLTVVQAVGTAARFRQIWQKAYSEVHKFRRGAQEKDLGTQRSGGLEFLADKLGNLELDLSFDVEASAGLGLLIPAPQIESFHKELYAAMELRERAETASRMFIRLDASIRSELTAIEIRERQQQEQKRLRWGAAVSVLSLIAVPIGFLVAYFGINATEVNDEWSIFDMHHYWPAYAVAGFLALVPLISFLILNRHAWRTSRQEKKKRQEQLQAESSSNAKA